MKPDSKNDDAVISSFENGNRVAAGYYTRGEWDLMQEIMSTFNPNNGEARAKVKAIMDRAKARAVQ